MSLRAKLVTTIAALCMVLCLLGVGVWAASTGTVNLGGTVNFTATDVAVDIYGAISGTKAEDVGDTTKTTEFVTADPDGEGVKTADHEIAKWDSDSEGTLVANWTGLDLEFADKDGTILIVIKVANKNTERSVKAVFAPTLKAGSDEAVALTTSAQVVGNVSAKIVSAPETIAKATSESAPTYVAYVIEMTIDNTNNKVDNVVLGGDLKLTDETVAG